ncbi:lysozyme g-like [Osmerus eperlanus]|uniref:lysozyme g-like n=1 Tax=Osmerus eperlanus TaxID=29151 RepID=UPI002E12778A
MSFGNVRNIGTTGASSETANADRQTAGPGGSRNMANHDLSEVNKHKDNIKSVGRQTGMDAAVIAGIISRESRGGTGLDSNGWGDHGNAFGLMQIDKRWHSPQGGPFSEQHIRQATDILKGCYGEIKNKFPSWNEDQCLKGALAAYNMGASRVHSYESVDANTTGGDYSNDVVARAQFFKDNGY